MPVRISIRPEKLAAKVLVDIFKMFCEAYGIEYRERYDGRFLRNLGIKTLRRRERLDYRPCLGAKFFGDEIREDGITFHGYSDPEDPKWQERDGLFRERVESYFRGR
ncbi:MAG: hypothetical protein HYW25_02225 [Candidatus Aenigmarchaeota archaeon]|nr:hypothetical protein [Candidatus Aenigmarchaeota archaeon]